MEEEAPGQSRAGVSPASAGTPAGMGAHRYELITSKLNLAKPQQKAFWEMRSGCSAPPTARSGSVLASLPQTMKGAGSEHVY